MQGIFFIRYANFTDTPFFLNQILFLQSSRIPNAGDGPKAVRKGIVK